MALFLLCCRLALQTIFRGSHTSGLTTMRAGVGRPYTQIPTCFDSVHEVLVTPKLLRAPKNSTAASKGQYDNLAYAVDSLLDPTRRVVQGSNNMYYQQTRYEPYIKHLHESLQTLLVHHPRNAHFR